MVPGCGGTGDSSESHDTDPPCDDLDSPPSIRRRTVQTKGSRPHSDLLNQILIDKFKVKKNSRSRQKQHLIYIVRRCSDLLEKEVILVESFYHFLFCKKSFYIKCCFFRISFRLIILFIYHLSQLYKQNYIDHIALYLLLGTIILIFISV